MSSSLSTPAFDAGQREAVSHTSGPLLIVAGAGTGKTTTVMGRIGALVAAGVDPKRILAITFTRKAAAEMHSRLPKNASSVTTSTIHAWCMRLLHSYYMSDGRRVSLSLWSDDDAEKAMRMIAAALVSNPTLVDPVDPDRIGAWMAAKLEDFEYSNPRASAPLMLSRMIAKEAAALASDLFNADDTPEYYYDRVAASADPSLLITAVAARAYERAMRARDATDFDFLQRLAVETLANEQILAEVQNRYDHVFVDEYQDTSRVQLDLIEFIAGRTGNLTVVGDPDQSIYRWRGAAPDTMDVFARTHPDTHVVHIDTNYRSRQAILDAANAVIADNPTRLVDRSLLRAYEPGDPALPVLAGFPTGFAEAKAIAARMMKSHDEGVPFADMAVLMRAHATAGTIEAALRERGIPCVMVGDLSFYERAVPRDLIAYATVLFNPMDDAATLRIVNTPRRALGAKAVDALVAEQRASPNRVSLFELMRRHAMIGDVRQSDAYAGFVDVFAHAYDHGLLTGSVVRALIGFDAFGPDGLLDVSGAKSGRGEAADNSGSGYVGWLHRGRRGVDNDGIVADLELVSRFVALADAWDSFQAAPPADALASRRSLADFVAWMLTQADVDHDPHADAVSVMTVHAAKGLEFDTVVLAGVEDALFPSGLAVKEGMEDEERRLMYVALTRAKRVLALTGAASRRIWNRESVSPLSRLIAPHVDCFDVRAGDAAWLRGPE